MTVEQNEKRPGKHEVHPQKGASEKQGGSNTAQAYDAIAYAVRVDAIKHLIEEFGDKHLTREYTTYALNLCDKISLTPDLDILRGHKAIWAAAITHVIARLNFLFDTTGTLVLTPALICSYFKTVKSTVGNRATQIQKTCDLAPGAKGFCRQPTGVRPGPGTQPKAFGKDAGVVGKQMKLFDL